MISFILKIIENNFGIMLVIAGISAYFFPGIFFPIKNYGDLFLMFSLFLGFLKIDLNEIIYLKENKIKMLLLIAIYMILIPIVYFLIFQFLDKDFQIGLFLLAVAPGALMGPLIANFLGLKMIWSMFFTLATSFLAPFIIPLFLKLLFSIDSQISIINMMIFLSKVIFIPGLIAYLFKKFLNKITNHLVISSKLLSTLSTMIFLSIVIARSQPEIVNNLYSIFFLKAVVLNALVFISLFSIGYFIPAKNIKEKLTNSLMFGNMNNGLVIIFASQFLGPNIALIVLISEIPWCLGQPLFSYFVNSKLNKTIS